MSNASKSEDFIDRKHENKPGGGRIKNVGGEGLDSMPKAGKQVGAAKGSGDLGKEERRQAPCKVCNGTKLVKGAAFGTLLLDQKWGQFLVAHPPITQADTGGSGRVGTAPIVCLRQPQVDLAPSASSSNSRS